MQSIVRNLGENRREYGWLGYVCPAIQMVVLYVCSDCGRFEGHLTSRAFRLGVDNSDGGRERQQYKVCVRVKIQSFPQSPTTAQCDNIQAHQLKLSTELSLACFTKQSSAAFAIAGWIWTLPVVIDTRVPFEPPGVSGTFLWVQTIEYSELRCCDGRLVPWLYGRSVLRGWRPATRLH